MDGPLFQLDETACVACGACVRDCAFRALARGDDGRPVFAHPERCMRCQHCFAICPTGAIAFDGRRAADARATKDLELPSAEAVANWLHVRRSTRQFKDEDVDRAVLDRVLTALGSVPTGCNARSLTFTCYPTRASLAQFKGAFIRAIEEHRDGTKLLAGMVMISTDETNPAVTTPQEDVSAAITYFEMLAQANGLATCWCGFLRLVQKEVPELLEKAAGIRRTTPFYAMLFGQSAVRYPRTVQRDGYAKIDYR